MTDHTKPVGWWCPVCYGPDSYYCAWGNHRRIPIYQPLPTPEPTTWGKSGGDEAVCLEVDNDGDMSWLIGFEPTNGRWASGPWFGDRYDYGDADTATISVDLPTAIRHVAEE